MYKVKQIVFRSIHFPTSFQDWRVICPNGERKYFSSFKVAESFINMKKGDFIYEV